MTPSPLASKALDIGKHALHTASSQSVLTVHSAGLQAAFSAALKYLDASSNLSGRIISAYMYNPQLNTGSQSAHADNSTCGTGGQMQQLHGGKSFGAGVACPAADTSFSSSGGSSKGLWQALLASMLMQQQQPSTGQVSQRRYLQQLSGLREHSSRIAGLLMLDSSTWAKAPAWELLQLHAPAALLTLQRLSDSVWTEVRGVSGAAVTVVSALIASRLLLEML